MKRRLALPSGFECIGALLHAPFLSKTRPWELRSVDGIDLFDVFCSFVKFETRKDGLLKGVSSQFIDNETNLAGNFLRLARLILKFHLDSNFVKYFFDFRAYSQIDYIWLNDRARYFLDFLDGQRLKNPIIRDNFDDFFSVTWKFACFFFKKELYIFFFLQYFSRKNFLGFTFKFYNVVGPYVDSFDLLGFKIFSHRLGVSSLFNNLNYFNYTSSDFRFNFIVDKYKLFHSKALILVGLDLRLENPGLNLKIFSLSRKGQKFGVFSFGSLVNPPYFVRSLGNSIYDLFRFLVGQHRFCIKFFFELRDYSYFLLGSGLGEVFKFSENIIKVFYNMSKLDFFGKFSYVYFPRYISFMSSMEFGINGGSQMDFFFFDYLNVKGSILTNMYFIYLFQYNFNCIWNGLRNMISNIFLIYHNSHFNEISLFAKLIFPAEFIFEKNSTFLNIEGRFINIFNNNRYCKFTVSDFDFFNFLIGFCREGVLNFSSFFTVDIRSEFLFYLPILRNTDLFKILKLSSYGFELLSKPLFFFEDFFILNFNPLFSTLFNFFKSEVLCRHSRILSSASKKNLGFLVRRKYYYDV